MGIRGLDVYLRERKLQQTAPLSALSGCRLGIDAKYYLTNLLNAPESQEPFVAATGGVHLSITQRVENDLRTLDRNHIRPLFVFAGLPTQGRPPPKGGFDPHADREHRIKQEAWGWYESGEVTRAVQTLSSAHRSGGPGACPGWADYRDVVRLVLRVFKHRQVECIFAPYLEHAQLAYLLNHPKGYIHAIYSSTETLLWQVDKVITSIDFPTSFTFVDKSRLLSDVQLNPDQFLDMGILAGCSLARTFPPIANDFTLRSAIDIVKSYKTGLAAVQQWRGPPNEIKVIAQFDYPAQFLRARMAVRWTFVLTTDGTCVPYALVLPHMSSPVTLPADVPADIDDVFSPRLPDELYFYMCKGLISPTVIGWLTTGMIVEPQPLSDTRDYQRFIKELMTEAPTSSRVLTLALLADALHPQWKQRRIGAHYWHDPPHLPPSGALVQLTHKDTIGLVQLCSSWTVPYAVLEQELRRQAMSTIDIKLCIGALADDDTAKATLKASPRPLERKDEFVANVIWRFLNLRGFTVANTHRPSLIGRALHAALVKSKVNDRFQEPMFIILELLRSGVLHGQKFGDEYRSGGPVSAASEEDQASSMLIMRCLSVLPLNFRPQQWAGPLSRELLVFNSFPRAVSKSFRQLLEAISVNMLLSGAAKKHRDEYPELMLSLPFQTETNTGFGILFKTYLDVTLYSYESDTPLSDPSAKDSQAAREAKTQALDFVEQSFESVKTPKLEVERGFRFWDAIMTAVTTIDTIQGPDVDPRTRVMAPAVIAEFKRADTWLTNMRP